MGTEASSGCPRQPELIKIAADLNSYGISGSSASVLLRNAASHAAKPPSPAMSPSLWGARSRPGL